MHKKAVVAQKDRKKCDLAHFLVHLLELAETPLHTSDCLCCLGSVAGIEIHNVNLEIVQRHLRQPTFTGFSSRKETKGLFCKRAISANVPWFRFWGPGISKIMAFVCQGSSATPKGVLKTDGFQNDKFVDA